MKLVVSGKAVSQTQGAITSSVSVQNPAVRRKCLERANRCYRSSCPVKTPAPLHTAAEACPCCSAVKRLNSSLSLLPISCVRPHEMCNDYSASCATRGDACVRYRCYRNRRGSKLRSFVYASLSGSVSMTCLHALHSSFECAEQRRLRESDLSLPRASGMLPSLPH